jgi:hypothetical protein
VRSAICRIFEFPEVTFEFDDATATKLLIWPLFRGCTNWQRLEKGEGKKRAAGVPAASVATAVDLEGKQGGVPPAKRPNSSLLEEAVYAIDALAGDPQANANYMEAAQGGNGPARNLICFCAIIQLRRVRGLHL